MRIIGKCGCGSDLYEGMAHHCPTYVISNVNAPAATQEQPAGSAQVVTDLQIALRIVGDWKEDSRGLVHVHKDAIRKAIVAALRSAGNSGSPRKVGEDAQPEKYERTHSRVWVNAWNEALEKVCELVAVNGDKLEFGPFSIGHNPKRVCQEHTMIVELIRALKHPVPALRPSSVPVGEQQKEKL